MSSISITYESKREFDATSVTRTRTYEGDNYDLVVLGENGVIIYDSPERASVDLIPWGRVWNIREEAQ